jgi:hypothetical protein
MRNFEDALKLVLFLSNEVGKLRKSRKDYLNSDLNPADKAEKVEKLDTQLKQVENERLEVLQGLVRYPPHFIDHAKAIGDFDKATPCAKSVFIMTKYPDGKNPKLDAQLKNVIETVRAAVIARGYHAHLAAEKKLHPNLWENVECHMLACTRGIAIVEDRFNPKLNPNVAMEWGWMRAMRKPVLFLVERTMAVGPVDVAGLIKGQFDWLAPEVDIPKLINGELP